MQFSSGHDLAKTSIDLEPDSPETRASAHRTLLKFGQEDLSEMLGVLSPNPSYTV